MEIPYSTTALQIQQCATMKQHGTDFNLVAQLTIKYGRFLKHNMLMICYQEVTKKQKCEEQLRHAEHRLQVGLPHRVI